MLFINFMIIKQVLLW